MKLVWRVLFVYVITRLRVQFENNLYEWFFSKSIKIAWARRANAIWAFWKTHDCKLFSRKVVWFLLIIYITKLHTKASSSSEMTHAYHVINKFISLANHNSNYKLYTSLTLNSCQKTVKCLLLSKSGKNVWKCHSESLSRKAWRLFPGWITGEVLLCTLKVTEQLWSELVSRLFSSPARTARYPSQLLFLYTVFSTL